MLRIGQVEVTAQNNKYTDGSVAGGVPATRLRAAALNALQEEVAGVVEGGGLDLDPDDSGQMLKALKLIFAEKTGALGALAELVGANNQMPYFTGANSAELTALTAFARELLAQNDAAGVLSKLGLGEAARQGVATASQMQAGTATNLLPTVAAVMSLFSKRAFAAADYIRIPDVPGGLIIQWGSYTPTGGTQTINLPVAFPSMNLGTVGIMAGTATIFGYVTTQNNGSGAFNLHTRNATGNLVATLCFTISLGW